MTVISILTLAGCQAVSGITESQSGIESERDTSIADALGPYDGPKARIALASFAWKVGGQGGGTVRISGLPGTGSGGVTNSREKQGYMTGLKDMLTTALVQSKRYRVLERSQLQEVQAEQQLGASGQVNEATAAEIGRIAGADILIVAAAVEAYSAPLAPCSVPFPDRCRSPRWRWTSV